MQTLSLVLLQRHTKEVKVGSVCSGTGSQEGGGDGEGTAGGQKQGRWRDGSLF